MFTTNNNSFGHDLDALVYLRDHYPLFEEFSNEVLSFCHKFLMWKKPERFFDANYEEIYPVRGRVILYQKQRCIRLVFNNGFVWNVSISSLIRQFHEEQNKYDPHLESEDED